VRYEAQVKILREQGVGPWNQWREENPSIHPNFSNEDFREASLSWANLNKVNFFWTNFNKADLIGANLSGANLIGVNFSAANLSEADFFGASLNGANLVRANLSKANLSNTNLGNADLSYADLWQSYLSGTELAGANLRHANLGKATLNNENLRETDLRGASLYYAILQRVDLSDAKLSKTEFSQCTMGGVIFNNVDLSRCKGLEEIQHRGPSTIGIDTIHRSAGIIPERFLRGAGVPEPFIINMKSLVGAMSPIEFYSCFISYSSKNQDFAERLYSDLQSRKVRCWFATEDLKIGDKLRPAFDEAIRVHDKLMVLLSEHSVRSEWVEKEVETAFEKERQQNRTVLFPIRLDDAVMETKEAWAADIRRTRHIGDFRQWKNHDLYKKAFERLLRDLKA